MGRRKGRHALGRKRKENFEKITTELGTNLGAAMGNGVRQLQRVIDECHEKKSTAWSSAGERKSRRNGNVL